MKIVFLGGTCGNNAWREGLISRLTAAGVHPDSLFNPVVPDWTPDMQSKEEQVKAVADYLLFYIGNPMQDGSMLSAFSMVEATMALYDKPERTVVVFDAASISGHQLKSHKRTCDVLTARFPQARIFPELDPAEAWLLKELL